MSTPLAADWPAVEIADELLGVPASGLVLLTSCVVPKASGALRLSVDMGGGALFEDPARRRRVVDRERGEERCRSRRETEVFFQQGARRNLS